MKQLVILIISLALFTTVISLPVTPNKAKPEAPKEHKKADDPEVVLEYDRYLKEVVNALESDPDFRSKIDKADEVDIRTGKIAHELEFVSHHVRTKLDEIKRGELERLRQLATKHFELTNDIDRVHMKIPEHLDHQNEHTFEIDDLKRLILKTSEDLAENDKQRREEFKEYEMQKEFEKQEKLKVLNDEEKKKYEEDIKQLQQKHNDHEKVHHPGNKAQLEEVWEKKDHMEGQEFDPKTFFMMHDIDGNGFWDENEVKALFVAELDKVYQQGLPEDDMKERAEEMERMREHVFKEADTNHDGLISYPEFVDQTKRDEFNRDPGWDTVDNVPQYTHEEYMEFERRRQEEIQRMVSQGLLPPHPNMPQGYYPGQQGGYQVHPNDIPYHQQQQQQQYHHQQPINPNQQPIHHAQQQQMHAQAQQQQHYEQQQQMHHQQEQQYHAQQQQQIPQHQQQPHQQPQFHPQAAQPLQLNQNEVYQHVPNPVAQQAAQVPSQVNQGVPPPAVSQPNPINNNQVPQANVASNVVAPSTLVNAQPEVHAHNTNAIPQVPAQKEAPSQVGGNAPPAGVH